MKIAVVSFWSDIETIIDDLQTYDGIIATEQAALDLMEAGITILASISDFDTICQRTEMLSRLHGYTEVVQLSAEKDESDTRAAIQYIFDRFPDAQITLFNDFKGRVDHSLALLTLFNLDKGLKIVTPQSELQLLEPGQHSIKNKQGYEYVSFIILETATSFLLKGFKYDTSQEKVEAFTDFLISNTVSSENGGIVSFTSGRILLIYSRDIS